MDGLHQAVRCTRLLAFLIAGALIWSTLWAGAPAAVAQSPVPAASQQAEISPFLARELAPAGSSTTFLVILRDQPDPAVILQDAGALNANRAVRLPLLYTELTAHAQTSQASLRAWLDARQAPYRAFYIVNMLQVTGDAALVAELSQRSDVARIMANPRIAQALAVAGPAAAPPSRRAWASQVDMGEGLPYGLDYTQAPQVWQMGYRGEGVVVASGDTGVQWDHPALVRAYRGWSAAAGAAEHIYNWYDAWDIDDPNDECTGDAQAPCDDNDHGTHTVGTMVGDATLDGGTTIGMAPDATWIGCRNMLSGVGTPASYSACFEFFLAPYPQGGDLFTAGRPDLAPHVVNNSWSCPPYEGCDIDSLRQVVETVRAAGIFVAASAGNSGPTCATVLNPIAIYDAVFSVGAHDGSGSIAGFSSRGPVTADGSQRAKPDIAAPGVGVYSSRRDNVYTYLSGTSMASPHVAGAVALLWSAVPELVGDVDATEQVLIKSATPVLANQCGEAGQPVAPNYTYGFGRLNVAAAVTLARTPTTISVSVVDCNAAPLSGALAVVHDNYAAFDYRRITNNAGLATIPLVATASITETVTATAVAGSAHFSPTVAVIVKGQANTVQLQAEQCGVPASLTVIARDAVSQPVVGLDTSLVDTMTGNRYLTTTDQAGKAQFPQVHSGTYRTLVSALGFDTPVTVVLSPGETVEIELVAKPTYQVFLPVVINHAVQGR